MKLWQKCPICNGNGKVSGGFYNHPGDYLFSVTGQSSEVCRQCKGTGMIETPEEATDATIQE